MRHAGHDVGGADTQTVVLAGRVDVHHNNVVGIAETFREFWEQSFGAAIGMGLKDGPDFAIRVAPSRRGQCSPNLGRVMSVVVVDPHAASLALELEAPLRAPEFPESRPHADQVQPQVVGHDDSRQDIFDIVQPRQLQAELSYRLSFSQCHEIASPDLVGSYLHRLPIHTRTQTISDNPGLPPLSPLRPFHPFVPFVSFVFPNHRSHPAFIPTTHHTPISWHQADKLYERFGHIFQVTEAIRVIHLNGRDHGQARFQPQESVIVLVGLDDEMFPFPRLGVGPQVLHHTAHDEGRVQAGLGEEPGDQGRGGGLAVSASHGDAVATRHHAPQHLVALDDRYPSLPGRHHLGVVGSNGRGHNHQVGWPHVPGGVPFVDTGAQSLQICRQR